MKQTLETKRAEQILSSRRIGIIMHGITGRMGYNQHLVRSIVAIRDQGGVTLSNGDRAMPDPILVGRNLEKVSAWRSAMASSGSRKILIPRSPIPKTPSSSTPAPPRCAFLC